MRRETGALGEGGCVRLMRARHDSGPPSGRHRRVSLEDLPIPPPRRLLWWTPLALWALDVTLRAAGWIDARWAAPIAVGGLILTFGVVCLLEGSHARKLRDGSADLLVLDGQGHRAAAEGTSPGLLGRVEMCEIQLEVVLSTLTEMCAEAGVPQLADKVVLRLVRDASGRPVA